MATIREELAAGIVGRGGEILELGQRRWKLRHPRDASKFMFIGQYGSLRVGPTVERSISLTGSPVYDRILAEGRAQLARNPTSPLFRVA